MYSFTTKFELFIVGVFLFNVFLEFGSQTISLQTKLVKIKINLI